MKKVRYFKYSVFHLFIINSGATKILSQTYIADQTSPVVLSFHLPVENNPRFPKKTIGIMLNEALAPLGIEIEQTRKQFFYMMTFSSFNSFKHLFQNFFLSYPICTSKKSTQKSEFVLTFAFDVIPPSYCDKELVELMSVSLSPMNLKVISISEIGLHHIPFKDLESFLVMLFGLIQNLNNAQ